jgi:hypothetical protein
MVFFRNWASHSWSKIHQKMISNLHLTRCTQKLVSFIPSISTELLNALCIESFLRAIMVDNFIWSFEFRHHFYWVFQLVISIPSFSTVSQYMSHTFTFEWTPWWQRTHYLGDVWASRLFPPWNQTDNLPIRNHSKQIAINSLNFSFSIIFPVRAILWFIFRLPFTGPLFDNAK